MTLKTFSAHTTTIDMFGSAKYRNFKYGADDHIAVVNTEKLLKYASVFVTSAIQNHRTTDSSTTVETSTRKTQMH